MAYDHRSIETKWQQFWDDNQIYRTDPRYTKPKKYILDMFPYPSGAGLHVGHPKGYTATDIVSRYYHARGYNVLHPMGFDAFGLPAENYAIKTGTHPRVTTAQNIETFISQLKKLGFSYDWDRMVDTTDPEYYKWTQWIFLELFKRGLAYEQDLPINYCPSCKTGLANEEVLSDNTCDRCGTRVERRPIRQWVLKITEYAERLISDLDGLDWPEGIKEMQRNWIGKSEGCEFEMKLARHPELDSGSLNTDEDTEMDSARQEQSIRVYTTRIDTVFGMTYVVLAPDHPKVQDFITLEQREACEVYIAEAKSKSDQDRTADNKEKTGVFTGSYVINPYNGESVPLWIADYVLGHYGTGAVMAVPAHDERDFAFAKKYNLPIKQSIAPKFTFSGEIEPRKEKDTIVRNCVDAIMENQNGEILLLKENRGIHLPGGGLDGEDEITALRREILEETGYTDIDIGKRITTNFYHAYKKGLDKNVTGTCVFYSVKVLSENRVTSEVEQGLHEMSWETKGNVSKFLNWDNHDFGWNQFINPTSFCDDGFLVNSSEFDGLSSAEARKVLTEKAESEGFGIKKVNYKLRDWLFSRQRYWGEPIPLIHISHADYARLPRIDDTKKSAISYSHEGEGVTQSGDTATKALLEESIFENIIEVKKKDKNIAFSEIDVFVKTEKGSIRFIGSDIEKHFSTKNRHELSRRKRMRFSVIQGLDSLIYENHESGYFEYRGKIVRVVLKETSPKNYIVKTYYVVGKMTAQYETFSQTARVFSRYNTDTLFIGNKEFSQVYDGINGKIIIDSRLPLTLPEVERYEPAGDGQSPLATVPSFVNVKLAENLNGKRETNTMPQWGGSCWYYLRYMNNKNPDAIASKDALEYWGIVDEYVGGAEHAVLHLLYARFWHKVLYDAGIVPTKEPFQKLTNVGMILAYAYERADGGLVAVDLVEERDNKFVEKETGNEVKQVVAKMSKSLKNVVNPNEIVHEYGADTLRLYEMSMSGFTDTAPWNPDAIIGVRRFLDKTYSAFIDGKNIAKDDMKAMKLLHKTIKKVGEDIVGYKFNTAISALMILLNEGIPTDPEFSLEWKEKFAILLHPFAPHMAEELYQTLRKTHSIYGATWPEYDEFMLVDDEVTIAVQVNGKLRGTITCFNGVAQEEVSLLARENPEIAKWLEGKTLVKEIFIPNKMLSIVLK